MARVWQLLVRANGDTRQAQAEMRKLQGSVKKFGTGVRNVGMGLTAGITLPLLLAAKMGVDELLEAETVSAATAAVIKSTGGIAGVTQKHVERLSESLLKLSGVDDQVIQGGANILLTFTKIKRQGGVFDRATKAALGLSLVFKKDMTSSSVLVGKALQDPIKGVGALGRVGVTFSKKQKDVIKRLVETGKSAQAQKLILKNLETQVKKAAEEYGKTLAGRLGKVKEGFAGVAASLVERLLPAFERLLGWVERGIKWFDGLSQGNQKLVGVFLLVAAAAGPVLIVVGSLVTAIAAILPVIAGISGVTALAVGSIIAFGVALIAAYRRSSTFREQVNKSFREMKKGVSQVLSELKKTISVWVGWAKQFWGKYGSDIRSNSAAAWRGIVRIIGPQLRALKSLIMTVLALMRGDWRSAWNFFKSFAGASWTGIKNIAKLGASGLKKIISNIPDMISGFWKAFDAAGRTLGDALKNAIISAVRSLAGELKSIVSDAVKGAVSSAAKYIPTSPKDMLPSGFRNGKSKSRGFGTDSEAAFDSASFSPMSQPGAQQIFNIYPQSQDVESIARRVAYLISSGQVQASGGMA